MGPLIYIDVRARERDCDTMTAMQAAIKRKRPLANFRLRFGSLNFSLQRNRQNRSKTLIATR